MKKTHDFIIVIYHGGAEYLQYPTPQTRERFHRMADCGANFIVSQHTHCIGCEEWYNGSYLLHGQGNFLFARQKMNPHLTKQGLVTELLIDVNDKGFEIKNHVVNIVNHVIKYDSRQDLTKFVERGKRIDDKEFIISEYQKLKVEEIMQKYLLSAKGDYPLRRITNRLFPKFKKNLGKSYTEQQILSNLRLLQDERRREDMYYVWHYLLDNINER